MHFDAMYESCLVGLRKPDPALFRHVLTSMGVPADRALFIDDIPANVHAARSVGITAIRVPGGRPGAYRQMFNELRRTLADPRVAIPITSQGKDILKERDPAGQQIVAIAKL